MLEISDIIFFFFTNKELFRSNKTTLQTIFFLFPPISPKYNKFFFLLSNYGTLIATIQKNFPLLSPAMVLPQSKIFFLPFFYSGSGIATIQNWAVQHQHKNWAAAILAMVRSKLLFLSLRSHHLSSLLLFFIISVILLPKFTSSCAAI